VAFTDTERLVGEQAKNQASINPTVSRRPFRFLSNFPQNTIFDVKRLIGRKFSDPTVQRDRKLLPYDIVEGRDGAPLIQVRVNGENKQFTAEQISAMILERLKKAAEDFLGVPVKHAVITVPA
jgi:molecular chaperone DnaK (HSP70)